MTSAPYSPSAAGDRHAQEDLHAWTLARAAEKRACAAMLAQAPPSQVIAEGIETYAAYAAQMERVAKHAARLMEQGA